MGNTAKVSPTVSSNVSHKGSHTKTASAAAPGFNLTSALLSQHDALQNLLSHLKKNIVNINKEETYQKDDRASTVERLQQRLDDDHKVLNSSTTSAFDRERYVNRTKIDEHELEFYKRDRQLQHGMFHSNLKLNHGLISRVNDVLKAYSDVMSHGRLTPEARKQLEAVSKTLPVPK